MNKPGQLTAMISSTAVDLPEHRKQVFDACLREGVFPIGMEQLPARDATGIQVSLEMVDKADIYIGIYAWRYGWVPEFQNPEQISVTEMEFNRAFERKKHGELKQILIFVMHDDHLIRAPDKEDGEEAQAKLKKFKARAMTGRIRLLFKSPEDLRGQVIQSLGEVKRQIETAAGEATRAAELHPPNLIPKPPEAYIAHPYSLLQTRNVVGRQNELNLLTDWVTTHGKIPADVRIFNLVAIGGMGKSALSWKWFNDIAPNEMRNLAGRMWWSFYESDAHWENFTIRALAYVSKQSEKTVREMESPDREDQLWRILDQKPFLLVLDGLERILLAYARMDAAQMLDDDLDKQTANHFGQAHGLPRRDGQSFNRKHQLRCTADHRAGQFLRRLARVKETRILISTRLFPAELQTDTGDSYSGCFRKDLAGLSDDDALRLWREFNVTGSREELLQVFNSVQNYPLLIRALAGEVAAFRAAPGDYDKWRRTNRKFNPARLTLKNAETHVLEYALRGLGDTQRNVLHTLAAFRMPSTWDTLRALLVEPLHKNKTASKLHQNKTAKARARKLCSNDQALDKVLAELEDRGLVGWDKRANRYDLHPIVRSVIWSSLGTVSKKKLYGQLCGFFKIVPKPKGWEQVERLEDLTGDIELVHVLVNLGRFDEAFREFRRCIHFATLYRLGANLLRRDLLARFFDKGFERPPRLTNFKGVAVSALAVATHLGGAPRQATILMERLVKSAYKSKDLVNFLICSCNYSNALMAIGKLHESRFVIRCALKISKGVKEKLYRCLILQRLGLGAAACGDFSESRSALASSFVAYLKRKQFQGAGIALAALSQRSIWANNPKRALAQASMAWNFAKVAKLEADFIASARLQGTAAVACRQFAKAEERLSHALGRARAINLVEEELPALIALANLCRQRNEFGTARDLLDQVWALAEQGPYQLWHADALNVLAQIERDQRNRKNAIAAAMKAYTLAWCDGSPYAYHHGLTNARKHLHYLGTPVTKLRPFDNSKFQPMPDVELNAKDEFWVDRKKLDSIF
jgi:hypothetical protein